MTTNFFVGIAIVITGWLWRIAWIAMEMVESRPRAPLTGTLDDFGCFYFREVSERVMYPWPIGDFDNAMDIALDAAMNYLQRTGQAQKFVEVQRVAAMAIVAAWKQGVRHRVKLTNIAIAAVERKMEPSPNPKRSQ